MSCLSTYTIFDVMLNHRKNVKKNSTLYIFCDKCILRIQHRSKGSCIPVVSSFDRASVVRLFPNSGQVAKSSIFVCSNCPENRKWPTWVETPFSEWPDSQIRRNSENCRLRISNTVLFSEFVSLLAHKWSCW